MKQLFHYTLSLVAAFFVLAMTSCEKKSREKVANTWSVISYYEETTHADGSTSTFSGSNSSVNLNELIIDMDGTWTWYKKSTFTTTVFGGSVFLTIKTDETKKGTWSSVQKLGENNFIEERLLFNTLSESTTTTQTGGGANPNFPDISTTSSESYAEGEKITVYKIDNLSKNSLRLETENKLPDSSGDVKNIKMTLVVME
ncbi:MAG: hypothetical protein ACO1N0_16390 [Fluviicola sp.]